MSTTLPPNGKEIYFHGQQPATPYVLSLSAAGFLYIGLADLIPGLHERQRPGIGIAQFLFIMLGIATILLLQGSHS
jgi:zinc and cadmium transporter